MIPEDLEEKCERCHEAPDAEMAEVYDPVDLDGPALIVHVSCIPEGWKLA